MLSPELELWLLLKDGDLVASLLLALDSVSLLLVVLALLLLEELLTTPLFLSLSLSLSLKNLNLSNMGIPLLDCFWDEKVLLFRDNIGVEGSGLILLDCLSVWSLLRNSGIPWAVVFVISELDTGEVAFLAPLHGGSLENRGISEDGPV